MSKNLGKIGEILAAILCVSALLISCTNAFPKAGEIKDNSVGTGDIPDATDYSGEEESKELEDLDKEIEQALLELEDMRSDVDSYFQNNSSIVSEIEVTDSNVSTEDEAYNIFNERGFAQYPIITEYSAKGEYSESKEISKGSSTKHPIYQTTYLTDDGEIWTIFLVNNAVMASPVSYNFESDANTEIIISETNSLISYDSATNKFYETIPDESELSVVKVERIDANVLENFSIGGELLEYK